MTNGSCGDDNGGCKDICLSTPNGPRCACWIGKDFVFGSKCSVPSEFTFTTCHSEIKPIILIYLCVLYFVLFRVVRDAVCIFTFIYLMLQFLLLLCIYTCMFVHPCVLLVCVIVQAYVSECVCRH